MVAVDRRSFLKASGSTGLTSLFADTAFGLNRPAGKVLYEVAAADIDPNEKPKHSIKFAVIGLDHVHIRSMTAAVQRGGGELAAVYSPDAKAVASFSRQFANVKVARSEDEILGDPSIKLVAAAPVPDQRAPLGIRVMRSGKDYLSDKPGIISLSQLTQVRKAIKETNRIFAIMYSERLEVKAAVKAGELLKAGAIGQVVQTIIIGPHQVGKPTGRPEWFWDPKRYGGILCDVGSHQADQFLFYTGSTEAQSTASNIANINHPQRPEFQDFGDMMLVGNRGSGYVRVDWFTPDGLGTWGDGRVFILGTDGYIELRKYVDIGGRKRGNHLFLVDKKETRYIDCNNLVVPFGPQLVGDIVNRTHEGQDQQQALLAAELSLKAQKNARKLRYST